MRTDQHKEMGLKLRESIDNLKIPSDKNIILSGHGGTLSYDFRNNVGIIDSGYRGELKEALHHVEIDSNNPSYEIQKGQRLAQICAPTLGPIRVEIVDTLEQLGDTPRGDGGFGSTGR